MNLRKTGGGMRGMGRAALRACRRIVVKVGSSVLAAPIGSGVDEESIRALVEQLSALRRDKREVVLVSSGAVSAGLKALGQKRMPKSMPHKQAAAAVGQGRLIQAYQRWFEKKGITIGQILLTHDDVHHRRRFLNARNTIFALLQEEVLPIVNENDTVSVEEIRFGDNDTLSSLIATMIEADLLIILTDVEGLYTANPRTDRTAQLIPEVDRITTRVQSMAQEGKTDFGSGGMITKLRAIQTVTDAGIAAVVAKGRESMIIQSILSGEPVGTFFRPEDNHISGRKSWIAFARRPRGKIVVDEGAQIALAKQGKSLLPSGVVSIEGEFAFGDSTACVSLDGEEFARGLVNYASADLDRIKGRKTSDIRAILGHKEYDEVIHRDNLVLL